MGFALLGIMPNPSVWFPRAEQVVQVPFYESSQAEHVAPGTQKALEQFVAGFAYPVLQVKQLDESQVAQPDPYLEQLETQLPVESLEYPSAQKMQVSPRQVRQFYGHY